MISFLTQLKWQFVLLQKNNIISISLAVTLIYGVLLYILKDLGSLDMVLMGLILNDPSVIGYFFIALSIYTERKHQILSAIFVTPVNIHLFLLAKTVSIVFIGVLCSLGLALSVKGFNFDVASFTFGSAGICILSALLGLIMLTFTDDFLNFAMLSIPVFLVFINIPLLQYLGVIDIALLKYLFPIQGSLDLIDFAISGTPASFLYSYSSLILFIPLCYLAAFRLFNQKIVHQ